MTFFYTPRLHEEAPISYDLPGGDLVTDNFRLIETESI
jgi:hypothetical protein